MVYDIQNQTIRTGLRPAIAGSLLQTVLSTLFQKPGKIKQLESPRNGFSSAAGFVIIVAGKKAGDIAPQT